MIGVHNDTSFILTCLGWFAIETIPEWFGHEDKLLTCNDKAFFCPRFVFFQTSIDVENEFGIVVRIIRIRNLETIVFELNQVTAHQLSIVIDLAGIFVFINAIKKIAIDDTNAIFALSNELDRLIGVLHLVVMRMWFAVGANQAIDAECLVVGLVAKVSSVEVIFILGIFDLDR